jgi:nucleoside-diphosphate-sugar epimerase
MHINVIGGSGFIGSRLCNRLVKNKEVTFSIIDKVLSNDFPDSVNIADVRSVETLRKSMSENAVIINLAAEHRDDVRPITLYDEVNVNGARNICNVAVEKNVKTIIFTSTVAVYGFAPIGTNEAGAIAPFNDYGRTKYAAEQIFHAWQAGDPKERTLVIIRPTVVFGERNRGNVYNLLKQVASGRFLMIGNGKNRKSMAYVENIAAFIEYSTNFKPGIHTYNYIDKPDFDMNVLVGMVNRMLGRSEKITFRLPYILGFCIGCVFDGLAAITAKRLAISSIRVKKFCSDSVFDTSISATGFVPPVQLNLALENTVKFEFLNHENDGLVYYSE